MVHATQRQVDELLARHDIISSEDAANGGRIAEIFLERNDEGAEMSVSIGSTIASVLAPLEPEAAIAFVHGFRGIGLSANDPRVEHMLAHLLVKFSRMFFDTDAMRMECTDVHVHESGYYVGHVNLVTHAHLHVVPQPEHDRHMPFEHHPGPIRR